MRWRDNKLFITTWVLLFMMLAALATACEKDDCDRRMDKYTNCMAWHGEKKCRPNKRVMEKTCGLRD